MTGVPTADLATLILAIALGAARATPVVWLVAPLGGTRLPATVRTGFALLLAALAAPILVASLAASPGAVSPVVSSAAHAGAATLAEVSATRLALLLAREVFVGLCLGFVASAAFRAAEVAGRLADTLRGANLAEVLVPTADERSSPLGALYVLLATVVFLQIGGVARLVDALLRSYQALPIGGGLTAGSTRAAVWVVAVASVKLIASGVGLAAPVIVALWLTDLALGLIARAAPQVQVYFLGLPLKGLLAIGVVLIGLGALEAAMTSDFGGWLRLFERTASAF